MLLLELQNLFTLELGIGLHCGRRHLDRDSVHHHIRQL